MESTWTHWTRDEDVKIIDALREAYNKGDGIVESAQLIRILPGRTSKAIKQRIVYLRQQNGYKKVDRAALMQRNRQFNKYHNKSLRVELPKTEPISFAAALSDFMESWVRRQQNGKVEAIVRATVEKAVAEKDAEIAHLKEMLRELKAVREAVEKYQRRD